LVRLPTRRGAILDKIYTNLFDWFTEPVILPNIASSDHLTVLFKPKDAHLFPRGKRVRIPVRSNNPNGKAMLMQALQSYDWSIFDAQINCQQMTIVFYNVLLNLLDTFLPVRFTYRHTADKPWINDTFRRLIRQRQAAFTSNDVCKYRTLRNKINKMSKNLKRKFYSKRMDGLRQSDPSQWWRETKRLTGQSNRLDLTGLASAVANGDMNELANLINYSLQHVTDDLTPLSANDRVPVPVDNFPDTLTIYPDQVFRKLEAVNIRKAAGPDGIPNWLLRDFAAVLCGPLCAIFNQSLREGYVPDQWKRANVIPIPKVHPPASVDSDLRPISLTPTVSKIFEALVGQHILPAVMDKLDPNQFGAVRGRSTVHALVSVTQKWHETLDAGNSIRTVFVDYAKAYDHVQHSIVLEKMTLFGIDPVILNWLHSFLCERQQRVKIGNTTSGWTKLRGSLPQGTWLGPLMFLGLINDLATSVHMVKFVDDVTLTEVIARGGVSIMQTACSELESFSTCNLMNINPNKTKQMVLGPASKSLTDLPLNIADREIERVHQFKLLGVIVNDQLKWDDHVNYICSKINKRLYFLKHLKRACLPVDDLLSYYRTVIRPVAEYACQVWHSSLTSCQSQQIEQLQRRAIKIIFNTNDIHIVSIIADLEPLSDRREQFARRLFQNMQDQNNCIHHMLPPKLDDEILEKLRHAKPYRCPRAKTSRYQKSFLIYALRHFQ